MQGTAIVYLLYVILKCVAGLRMKRVRMLERRSRQQAKYLSCVFSLLFFATLVFLIFIQNIIPINGFGVFSQHI